MPPVLNYFCKTLCKPIDLIYKYLCSNRELCSYYVEVNALSVKNGVESRWLRALRNKILGYFKNLLCLA